MYIHAVHAFSAEVGEEGGVDVEDGMWKCLNQGTWDQFEVACEDDEVNMILLHQSRQELAVAKVSFIKDHAGHLPAVCALDDACVGVVGHDEGDGNLLMGREMFEDAFGIRAAAGGEDGYVFHFFRSSWQSY